MPVETMKYQEVMCEIIQTQCQTSGSEGQTVYGIKVEFAGDPAELFTVGDISPQKEHVQRLAALLTEYGVTTDHLMDIIEDFVQGLFM